MTLEQIKENNKKGMDGFPYRKYENQFLTVKSTESREFEIPDDDAELKKLALEYEKFDPLKLFKPKKTLNKNNKQDQLNHFFILNIE